MTNPNPFIQTMKAWQSSLAAFVPYWQAWREQFRVGWTWLQTMATPVDIERQQLLESINDWAPGSPGASPTALPLVANTRGLIQGEEETNDHFALRLINFRTNGLVDAPPADPPVWSQRGKSELLAQQLQQFIAGNPIVRVIERIYSTGGTPQAEYFTANTDGTTSAVVADWDWDSVLGWTDDAATWTGTQCRTFWTDFWIVITVSPYSLAGSITPLTGMHIPLSSRDAILRIVGSPGTELEFAL